MVKTFIFNLVLNRYTVTPTGFTVHRASSALFSCVRAWLLRPNLTPQLRRTCAGVSGSVGFTPIPSSICPAAGALVCGRPSSLLAAFKLWGFALAHRRQADASPSEVWEAKASLGPDNQLFPSSEKVLPTRQFLPYSDNLYCILLIGLQFRNPSKISFSKFSNNIVPFLNFFAFYVLPNTSPNLATLNRSFCDPNFCFDFWSSSILRPNFWVCVVLV